MKRLLILLVGAVAISSIAADTNPLSKRIAPRFKGGRAGSIIEKPYSGKVFRILNTQDDFAGDKLTKLTRDIRYAALLPIECIQGRIAEGESPFKTADALVASDGVGAGALIVSDPELPIELISPDRRWGILNIAPLKADNPTPEKFDERFIKAYWGIVARSLGAGTSSFPGCVLVPFSDIKGLDAIRATRPCPEPFNKMIETGSAWGIGIISIASYRDACLWGWAPQPTNDVEKAIWDEVHAMPTEPIKIKPETKKVKD